MGNRQETELCIVRIHSNCEMMGGTHVDVGQTEVNPVGNDSTDGDGGSLDTDQETSVLGLGTLGNPRWDGSGVGTVSKTSDDSTNDELDETTNISSARLVTGTESGNGDDGTDDHNPSTKSHHSSSTEPFTDKEGEEGSKETSDLVVSRWSEKGRRRAHLVTSGNRTLDGTSVHIVGVRLSCLQLSATDLSRVAQCKSLTAGNSRLNWFEAMIPDIKP